MGLFHINRLKKKNHLMTSLGAFVKIQYIFMVKTLKKLEIKGNLKAFLKKV